MRNFPFFRQLDSMDCGPTCLKMIAKYYKMEVSLDSLRKKSQIGKDGTSLLGISVAAESIGFRCYSARLSYKVLTEEAQLPCILHWNQYHFVILYKAKRNKLSIADPGVGFVNFTLSEFKQRWISTKNENGEEEGIAMFLEPEPGYFAKRKAGTDKPRRAPIRGLYFKRILRLLIPYKKLILQLFIGIGLASLFQLLLPFLAKSIIDIGVNTANLRFIYIVLMAQSALLAGRLVVDFIQNWILLHIGMRVNISILTDFLIKLMKLPLAFFDSKKTGDIIQRMNDHQRIESFLTSTSMSLILALTNVAIFSVVLAIFNYYIFIIFMIASILYSAWVFFFLKKKKILDYKRFDTASQEQGVTIQMVQAMQEIKLNGMEKPVRLNWERIQARLFRLNMRSLGLNQWQQCGGFFLNEGKSIFITFLSAKAVVDGQMTLGAMLAVQYIIGQLNSPIEQMIGFIQSWQNAKISMARLNEIHGMEDEEPEHKYLLQELPACYIRYLLGGKNSEFEYFSNSNLNMLGTDNIAYRDNSHIEKSIIENDFDDAIKPNSWSLRKESQGIRFCDVSFTYVGAGNEPVLSNVNLFIPRGKTTAIVGISGSGKTTMLKLLLKFYEPQKGDIRLNSTSISNISHKVWRSHCGVVMQESFIFSESIARNIAVGVEEIDEAKLKHATDIANINEFIKSLPLGFNTNIGAEGIGISMGQKQRILIARAVYRDPEFIFLDEATNSLDAKNESMILKNLDSFLVGKTVIVVAHRLSTVRNADQIVVLNNGMITERGTHRDLVILKGEYYALVKNQLELSR